MYCLNSTSLRLLPVLCGTQTCRRKICCKLHKTNALDFLEIAMWGTYEHMKETLSETELPTIKSMVQTIC